MKHRQYLIWMVPVIFLLALVAAAAGLWPGEGTPYTLTNFRGEEVTLNARGVYYWDTLSSAAQMQANDLVTLVLGLPLLAVSFWLSLRGSLRGRLILAGTLGFILYTYMSMSMGTAYNPFFLIYVLAFSFSLLAFILTLLSFDLKSLPGYFSPRLPRKSIAALLLFAAAFLTVAWLGRILPTISPQSVPQLENVSTMFIQAMDLGLVVPLCVISAVQLLRGSPWGYLLASVGMLKFVTMGLAVSLMGLNMARVGVPISPVELGIFLAITLVNLGMTAVLLLHIREKPEPQPAVVPAC